MEKKLHGKVALVTGAGGLIGRDTVRRLAEAGAGVAAADIVISDELNGLVREIAAGGGRAVVEKLDITDSREAASVFQDVERRLGPVDILVNNAGVGSRGIIYDQTSKEDFDKIMAINAWGPFAGMKTVAPVMKKAGKGAIVNVSSLAAVVGVEFNAYSLTKGAVVSLTRAASVELGKDHIRVNTIIPGTIVTPMTKIICDYPKVLKSCEDKTCLGHIGEPNDIAYGVLYLASDEAKYITGADLTIDGGERFKDVLKLELN